MGPGLETKGRGDRDTDRQALVEKLDSPDLAERQTALSKIAEEYRNAQEATQESSAVPRVNVHVHTIFSYNPQGWSPSRWAARAKELGLEVAGKVEFDVLDNMEEFFHAGRQLNLKTVVSVESRVFIPEFADLEINSPGEPGIAYHMGAGFTTMQLPPEAQKFLMEMARGAAQRNRELVNRVNEFTNPVRLDYDRDVLPLTPNGNATERHICLAYAAKAARVYANPDELADYWTRKLGPVVQQLELPHGADLQGKFRKKTMKRGGVGYVQPGPDSFPNMEAMNRFALESNAIPTLTWLNGLSAGEQQIERLLEVQMKSGVAMVNIIPDRNFTPGVQDQKLKNLCAIVELCRAKNLPILVGTEMNSPGQKDVDDFESEELAPFVGDFLAGAHILYAHTVLQRAGGMGYLSEWAAKQFGSSIAGKNEFFRIVGATVTPRTESLLADLPDNISPEAVHTKIGV
jgi:hypothetical protein